MGISLRITISQIEGRAQSDISRLKSNLEKDKVRLNTQLVNDIKRSQSTYDGQLKSNEANRVNSTREYLKIEGGAEKYKVKIADAERLAKSLNEKALNDFNKAKYQLEMKLKSDISRLEMVLDNDIRSVEKQRDNEIQEAKDAEKKEGLFW